MFELREINKKAKTFINFLLLHPIVQNLKLVDDQGIEVSTHTYDVLKIVIEKIKIEFGGLKNAATELDFFAIVAGIILHDSTKATIRLSNERLSHSAIMTKKPDRARKEAEKIITEVEELSGIAVKEEIRKRIIHIVLSHHGRWGKILPGSKEAVLVHKADKYSALYHRINPIGANQILVLKSEGMSDLEISEKLGCTMGILRDRLKKAKIELGLKSNKQLLSYYINTKNVPDGDAFFCQRLAETSELIAEVEKNGFEKLVNRNELIGYIVDEDIFEQGLD